MPIRIHPYRLPLKRPWVAAAAILTERRGWLLEVIDENGIVGWGDCAPLPSAGTAHQARCRAALERLAATGAVRLEDPPEVRWAHETAVCDVEAQRRKLPLARMLGASTLEVPVNAALGALDDPCAERARAAAAQGYRIGKIKVGIAPIDVELTRLRQVAAASELRLRLDANRAWPEADARRFLDAIVDLPIDGIEEPLADPTCAGLARLQARLPFPIAADESLPRLGLDALIDARAVRRLVIKPARIGGVSPTLTLAQGARDAGIEVVLTSVVDSAIGVAAAAHLAVAIAPHLAHGLATGDWLAEDVAPPLPIVAGRLQLPDAPGIGHPPTARRAIHA